MKKEDIVSILNEFFGFEANWSKMSKDDLMKIYEFLNEPKNIINRLIDIMGYDKLLQTVNNTILHRVVDEKPIRKLIKSILFEERE